MFIWLNSSRTDKVVTESPGGLFGAEKGRGLVEKVLPGVVDAFPEAEATAGGGLRLFGSDKTAADVVEMLFKLLYLLVFAKLREILKVPRLTNHHACHFSFQVVRPIHSPFHSTHEFFLYKSLVLSPRFERPRIGLFCKDL
jgi:hypothetical protein